MTFLSKLVCAAIAVTLLAGTVAAQPDSAEELAKVRSDLVATQKALTESKHALAKSQKDLAAAQAKLAETTRTAEALREELASKKAQHSKAAATFKGDTRETGSSASLAKLAETIKTGETLRAKLESENAQLKTAAAELDVVIKAAIRMKAELVGAQKALSDDKLAKTQEELATSQKSLAESKQALTDKQAELAQIARARETLAKEVAAEKERSAAVSAQLVMAIKEAARTKAELVATQEGARTKAELMAAQKALADAKLAKTQMELATTQRILAETRAAADEGRKSLQGEIQASVAQLEAANKETVRTKEKLSVAQKILSLQPPLPVTVVVTLPADAKLTFDDVPTTSTGRRRVFISPALSVGPSFQYVLKAEVMRDGKLVTMRKYLEVRAGDRIEISFSVPATADISQVP